MNGEKKEIPKGTLGLVELYCLSIGQVIGRCYNAGGAGQYCNRVFCMAGVSAGHCSGVFYRIPACFYLRHTSAGRRLLLPHWSADQQDVSGNVRVCAAYKAFEHLIVCGEPGGVCPVFVSAGQHHGLRGGVPDVFLCGESVRN